jgi:hypothetical protein
MCRHRVRRETSIDYGYKREDKEEAMHKLSNASRNYTEPFDAVKLGFSAILTPHEFKEQVERCLNLRFTAAEAGTISPLTTALKQSVD